MPPKSIWHPDDSGVPVGQGDLLQVAWAKTIGPGEATHIDRDYPILGRRDAFDLRFWDDRRTPQVLEMWGRANYALAVVITEGCAIDKEFNILRQAYLEEGCSPAEATKRALEDEEGYVSVAEVWPIEALPQHLRDGAASGAVGYVPFTLGSLVPDDTRQWAVDLSRVATVSIRSIQRRIGTADGRWVLRLQSALCRYYAARSVRVTEDLTEIFQQVITRVEALTPPSGSPPRVRARLHFEGGRKLDLEAILSEATTEEPEEGRRPGLHTRE
jgi:hypothetical protein